MVALCQEAEPKFESCLQFIVDCGVGVELNIGHLLQEAFQHKKGEEGHTESPKYDSWYRDCVDNLHVLTFETYLFKVIVEAFDTLNIGAID